MNLLVIVEGYDPRLPPASLIKKCKADKVYLLYLSPRVKTAEYKSALEGLLGQTIKIEVINYREYLDYEKLRRELFDFIAGLPKRLQIGKRNLCEYLDIQGLNMWWSSGIVEATVYKRDLMPNLYHLAGLWQALIKFPDINAAWLSIGNRSLFRDMLALLRKQRVSYYGKCVQEAALRHYLRRFKSWFIFVLAHFGFALIFKVFSTERIMPINKASQGQAMHIFYSYYPYSLILQGKIKAKIYDDLPILIKERLGGESYYLSYISPLSIFKPLKLIKDARKMWAADFHFIPMNIFVSGWDALKIFISPVRYWRYFRIRSSRLYRGIFKISGINMFYTFDRIMKDSLVGDDAWNMLLHYCAFRNFTCRHKDNIRQVVYHIEFHNWEAALINGVKAADKSVLVIGLQQSAPNPVLLSPFFMDGIFKDGYGYPLPDLILCTGELYRNLLLASGIAPERVGVTGHLGVQSLFNSRLDNDSKAQKRGELNLPIDRKICLVACCVNLYLTEGVICLLSQVVKKIPDIIFLIQGHPDSPVGQLLSKYGMSTLENVRSLAYPISKLLPLADSFISLSTSVSQEALCVGVPQVNLDAVGLPKGNPLHIIPGFISDVDNPQDLISFLRHTDRFPARKDESYLFMGDPEVDPRQRFFELLGDRKANE